MPVLAQRSRVHDAHRSETSSGPAEFTMPSAAPPHAAIGLPSVNSSLTVFSTVSAPMLNFITSAHGFDWSHVRVVPASSFHATAPAPTKYGMVAPAGVRARAVRPRLALRLTM